MLTDDTPVGVKVTLDKKRLNGIPDAHYVVAYAASGAYSSDDYYLVYDVSEKSFGSIAEISTAVNDVFFGPDLPPKDFILFVVKPSTIDGSFTLDTSISATQNIFYNSESTFAVAEGTVPELVYYKDLINY